MAWFTTPPTVTADSYPSDKFSLAWKWESYYLSPFSWDLYTTISIYSYIVSAGGGVKEICHPEQKALFVLSQGKEQKFVLVKNYRAQRKSYWRSLASSNVRYFYSGIIEF